MAAMPPEPLRPSDAPAHCSHPWLRVTCGVCGAAVDELREDSSPRAPQLNPGDAAPIVAAPSHDSQKLFIVARGHPELVEQLKALLGDSESIRVLEDRRRTDRPLAPSDAGAPSVRTELRRRVREGESPEGE